MDELEQWLPVVNWETTYEVSDRGQVRRLGRAANYIGKRKVPQYWIPSHLLSQQFKDNRGVCYYRVNLHHGSRHRTAWVHTLMLEAFVSIAPEGREAAHLDGDSGNNALTNLEWKSTWDNYQDRLKHGTQVLKIQRDECEAIRTQYAAGGVRQRDLAVQYGISQTHAGRIIRGERRSIA